jgi:glutamate-1-semialdehyde 2,1-aminomutase
MQQLPMVVKEASGDTLIDVDGGTYIDFCCSWGTLIHGHAPPSVVRAAQERVALGSSFGITTPYEGELAKAMIALVPALEKVRFVSSGTEATMSAIRLARGVTGRNLIIKFSGNYHGHADFFLVQAGSGVLSCPQASSVGIPEEMVKSTFSLPYNDPKALMKITQDPLLGKKIAAVIVEPIAGNMGVVPAFKHFLETLREETTRIGALLIFDEVITGFRVAAGGAQALYNISPDLSCFGKIMGGGFPAAAFGGKREIMDHLAPLGTVYQAGTLSGNPVAMVAGREALRLLCATDFYTELERKTNILTQPIKKALEKSGQEATLQQVGSMFTLFLGKKQVHHMEDAKQIDSNMYAHLFRYLFDKGIYIPPSPHEAWFISTAHTEKHLECTRDHILEFLEEKR